jgi:hypothetical protein
MKKFLTITQKHQKSQDYLDSLISFLHGAGMCDDTYSYLQPIRDHLPASMGVKQNVVEFETPFILQDHHTRHFFAKMQRGIFAVQKYSGKKFNTMNQAENYFVDVVGRNAYGPNWLVDLLMEHFEDRPQGRFAITDVSIWEAKTLKKRLGATEVATILVTGKEEDVDKDRADLALRSHDAQGNPVGIYKKMVGIIRTVWNINPSNKKEGNENEPESES